MELRHARTDHLRRTGDTVEDNTSLGSSGGCCTDDRRFPGHVATQLRTRFVPRRSPSVVGIERYAHLDESGKSISAGGLLCFE